MNPVLSIMMPVKNNRKGVLETYESLKGILSDDVELIIQDYRGESGLGDLHREENKWCPVIMEDDDSGIPDANNRAVKKAARGKYLMFWGAGEIAQKDGFMNAISLLKKMPVDILFNSIKIPGNDMSLVPNPGIIEDAMSCLTPGAMISRELFLNCGGLDTRYPVATDYALFVKLLKSTNNYMVTSYVVVEFPLDGMSSTTRAFEGYIECELIRMREYGKSPVSSSVDMIGIAQSYLRQNINIVS